MRILFIERGAGVGGSIISLYYLARELQKSGFEPVIHFPEPHGWSPRFEALGVEIHYGDVVAAAAGGAVKRPAVRRLPWVTHPWYETLAFYKHHWRSHDAEVGAWQARIEELRPAIVYGNNAVSQNLAPLEAARRSGRPAACHLRALQPLRAPHRRFAPELAAGVAISDVVRDWYLRAGFPAARIHVVRNGIDLTEFPYADPGPDIPPGGGRLLFLGRMEAWKGLGTFLEAVRRLRARRGELSAVVAGEGPERAGVEEASRRMGLAGIVRFTGYVTDVRPLLQASDLLVHCSTSPEPFGRVLLEGMATGTPVVATRHGAPTEIIRPGETGWLTRPADAAELADQIDRALASGADRLRVARAARAAVEERFTVEKTGVRIAEILRQVVAAGR